MAPTVGAGVGAAVAATTGTAVTELTTTLTLQEPHVPAQLALTYWLLQKPEFFHDAHWVAVSTPVSVQAPVVVVTGTELVVTVTGVVTDE